MKRPLLTTILLIIILPCAWYGVLLWHILQSGLAHTYGLYTYPSHTRSLPELSVGSQDFLVYSALAENIIDHGVFSVSEHAPYLVEYQRLPAYPLFVALLLILFRSYVAVAIAQIGLTVCTGFLIWKLGARLFNRKAGYVAAYLFLLSPAVLVNTLSLYTETLFIFLLVSGAATLWQGMESMPSGKWTSYLSIGGGGVLIGLSAHARPIAIFFPFVLMAWCALLWLTKRLSWRRASAIAAVSVVAFMIPIVPWVIRNYAKTGLMSFTSVSAYNFLFSDVRAMLVNRIGAGTDKQAEADRITRMLAEEAAIGTNDIGSPSYVSFKFRELENVPQMNAVALKYVRMYPFSYLEMHAIGSIRFFITSSVEQLIHLFPTLEPTLIDWRLLPKAYPTLYWDFAEGNFAKVFRDLSSQILLAVERLFWMCVVILAGVAAVMYRKRALWSGIALCALTVLYFAALSGPVSASRYRTPALPFLFLLAVGGAAILIERFTGRRRGEPDALVAVSPSSVAAL